MIFYIRKAEITDASRLTEISFESKHYWNYPDEYFEIWRQELTITEEYIRNNNVFVAFKNKSLIGYASLSEVKEDFMAGQVPVSKGFWLEHMFVIPKYIGKGVGRGLFLAISNECQKSKIPIINIFADPNATGFYEKMNCVFQGETPSSIPGRNVALYQYKIESDMNYQCICKRKKCPRFGKCDECRSHHSGLKSPVYCERKKSVDQ